MTLPWNLHWAQSDKYLLVIVTSAVVIDSVLTILVIGQQHDHSTTNRQANLPVISPALVPSVPAPASAAPQWAPAPQVTTSPTPSLVTSAPQVLTAHQQAPAHHKSRTPQTLPAPRVNPMPARPPLPAPPPTKIAKSDTAVKPGAPPEMS